MFYTAADLRPVIATAVDVFGPMGRVSGDKNAWPNVSIATKEYGKLWYGDVDRTTLKQKCNELSSKIGKNIYVFDAANKFEYNDNTLYSTAP